MNFEIHTINLHLTGAEEDYVRSRLRTAMTTNHSAVDTVHAWLCDLPGFECDLIKHCRVEVTLTNGRSGVGDSSETDLDEVIQRAAERACRQLAGGFGRQPRAVDHDRSSDFRTDGRPATEHCGNPA